MRSEMAHRFGRKIHLRGDWGCTPIEVEHINIFDVERNREPDMLRGPLQKEAKKKMHQQR